MWATAIRNIKLVGELATLWAAVTSATELVAQFQKLEERCSWLEQPDAKICNLLLQLPPNQARWADHMDEVVG
jgi:hypothetical protein